MKTLNDLFNEVEATEAPIETPAEIARRAAKAEAEKAKEIRQGVRTSDGDWVETVETDDEDDDNEEDENDDDEN